MAVIYGCGVSEKLVRRQCSDGEVEQTLAAGVEAEAHSGREARTLVFPFQGDWRGRQYQEKEVKVVFIREGDDVIVVSVTTRFGRFT